MEQDRIIKFLVYWIVVSIVINLSGSVFGSYIHLGNTFLQGSVAAVITGLILTILYYRIPTMVKRLKFKVEKENQWIMIFFVSNAIAIWIFQALAFITGLVISGILFVLTMAAFVTFGQLISDKIWSSFENDKFPTLIKE